MVMEGTWFDAAAADRKFRSWIGDYSGLKDARIVLEEQVGPAGVAGREDLAAGDGRSVASARFWTPNKLTYPGSHTGHDGQSGEAMTNTDLLSRLT